jgi:hypothetical protein
MAVTQPFSRNQTQTILIAGAVAHTIFQVGWFAFGMSLAALVATALFGDIITTLARSLGTGDPNALLSALDSGSDLLFWFVVSFLVSSVILVGLAILASGWMLSAASFRTPWKTTMAAVGVAALVDIALFWIYVGLANLFTDSQVAGPVLLTPVMALIGGTVAGALIWWIIALVRREKTDTPVSRQ